MVNFSRHHAGYHMVEVSRLIDPGVLIEIEADASCRGQYRPRQRAG
jgi:hypothetical protein